MTVLTTAGRAPEGVAGATWPLGSYVTREQWEELPECVKDCMALSAVAALNELHVRLVHPPILPVLATQAKAASSNNVIKLPARARRAGA